VGGEGGGVRGVNDREYANLVNAFVDHLSSRPTRAKRKTINRRFSIGRLISHPAVVNIGDDVRLNVDALRTGKLTWDIEIWQSHGWVSRYTLPIEQRLRSAIVMAKRMRPSVYDHLAEIVPGGPEFEAILAAERLT
jgi:hypothetical protein